MLIDTRRIITITEANHAGLSVADGSMKYEELLAWVRKHEAL